jgi:Leucine Rich repeats (2 copies)
MLRRHLGSILALAFGLSCFACSSSDDAGSENNPGGGGGGQAGAAGSAGQPGEDGGPGDDAGPLQPVQFTDTNLEQCVRTALEIPDGDIMPNAFAGLAHLECQDAGITNVVGLEHAGALIELSLFENEIADITPLAGLTQLRDLQLGANQIQDISALSGMTSLRRLGLVSNQIASLQPLAGLTTLEWLNLDRNAFGEAELVHLAGLTNLRWLTIEHNGVSNHSALQPLLDSGCKLYDQNRTNALAGQLTNAMAPASQMPRPTVNPANLRPELTKSGAVVMRYDLNGKTLRARQPTGKLRVSGSSVSLPLNGRNIEVGKIVNGKPVLCQGAFEGTCDVTIGVKYPEPGAKLPGMSSDPIVTVAVDLIDAPKTEVLDGEDWTLVDRDLEPYVLASPNQIDAGSCIFMAHTGAMEILMNQHTPVEDIAYNGDTDLSERYLMGAPATTADVPYFLTDLVYSYEATGGSLLSRDYNFCVGYCVDDASGDAQPAKASDKDAYLTAQYNWFDMMPTDWQSLLVPTPLADRTVIFADPKRDSSSYWRVGLLDDDAIEEIKYELRTKNAPVVMVFNYYGWWHSNIIVGYDDTAVYDGCAYVQDAADYFRGEGQASYANAIEAHVDATGCSDRGKFYVRDSIYEGGSAEEDYDYSWGSVSYDDKYSRRITGLSYDWAKHLSNHAYTVHRR